MWEQDLRAVPVWKAWGVRTLRILHAVANEFRDGQISVRAMSLVYATLLSLAPLLAVAFAMLKQFGVHNEVAGLLKAALAPLGPEKGPEIATQILSFVDNMKVGVLGTVGVAVLFYTVTSLVQKIESALNYAWHTRQTRPIGDRVSRYLVVIILGPILMATATSLSASASSNSLVQKLIQLPLVGDIAQVSALLLPYGLLLLLFTFIYSFVPNTRVRLVPALVGGAVAAIGWEAAAYFFAKFVVASGKYNAIYSGFGTLFLAMIWMYIGWLILIVGASVAYYVQYPRRIRPERTQVDLSNRIREKLALLSLSRLARDHQEGRRDASLDVLANSFGLSGEVMLEVLDPLEEAGLVVRSADDPPVYLPGQAPEALKISHVLEIVRSAHEGTFMRADRLPADPEVERVLGELDAARRSSLADLTLNELATRSSERQVPGEAG